MIAVKGKEMIFVWLTVGKESKMLSNTVKFSTKFGGHSKS